MIRAHGYAGPVGGGPVDYRTAVFDVSGRTATVGPVAPGTKVKFAVRNYDTANGIEESNQDVVITLEVDLFDRDVSDRPKAPDFLRIDVQANGYVLATWEYHPSADYAAPSQYNIYTNTGDSVDYSLPIYIESPFMVSLATYRIRFGPFADGVRSFGIKAARGIAESENATEVAVTIRATPPLPVEGLTAEIVGG
jgi:hypothetical protein